MPNDIQSRPEQKPVLLCDAEQTPASLSNADTLARSDEKLLDVNAYLANERTYLAWSFVAIFIIGSGVALARTLIALNTSALVAHAGGIMTSLFYPTTIGLVFLVAGLIVIVMATCRFLSVQQQITRQDYKPSNSLALIFLAVVLTLCLLLAGFLLQMRGLF